MTLDEKISSLITEPMFLGHEVARRIAKKLSRDEIIALTSAVINQLEEKKKDIADALINVTPKSRRTWIERHRTRPEGYPK